MSLENSSNHEKVLREDALIKGGKLYAKMRTLMIYLYFLAGLPIHVSLFGTLSIITDDWPSVQLLPIVTAFLTVHPIPKKTS